ncbi:AAA family ATPase [Litorimonas sp. WD9-15]|uniref:AAA family ATPase n=1 Tax=Litorimonas sp. WD9-15 TaxID=3418716 RepID=UPI003CFCFF42
MDPVRNPFAPGAGAPPPELVGRADVLSSIDVAIRRAALGKPARSHMLLGLRGTGKTVLLHHTAIKAQDMKDILVWEAMIEAPEGGDLPKLIFPLLRAILRKLSVIEASKKAAYSGLRALRSFASAFKLEVGAASLSVDPEPGVADSGDLLLDLSELFVRIGTAAKDAGGVFLLLLDEVQYLSALELSAIITSLHKCSQATLPVIFIGGGLPQVAGLAGNAKSYAERLFDYHVIGPLSEHESRKAVQQPILDEGESITSEALDQIVADTMGYPYFLQEWGYHAWNVAEESPINIADAVAARENAIRRLDEGFFKVRLDRLTPKEREYVHAMASLGREGPYRSGDIAQKLGEASNRLGPRRAAIIKKGMIYSPDHGDADFTVPGFADYLQRLV